MPHIKIRVHLVFSTTDSKPHITEEIRNRLIARILLIAAARGFELNSINGWTEHLHLLISLPDHQSLDEVAEFLMRDSEEWINTENETSEAFAWDRDYFAVSVSESSVRELKNYIDGQPLHHSVRPFKNEMKTLRRLAGRV